MGLVLAALQRRLPRRVHLSVVPEVRVRASAVRVLLRDSVTGREVLSLASAWWTLDEATRLCRFLWPRLMSVGWHLAVTGSVMTRGQSRKDLDLVAYPRRSGSRVNHLRSELRRAGLTPGIGVLEVRKIWRDGGSRDSKHVEVWWTEGGRRIDLFVLR